MTSIFMRCFRVIHYRFFFFLLFIFQYFENCLMAKRNGLSVVFLVYCLFLLEQRVLMIYYYTRPCVVRFAANSELQEARIRFLQRVKAEVFKAKREGKLNSSGTKGVLFPIRWHPYVCTFLRMACILRTRPTTRKTTLFIVGPSGPFSSTCTYTHT